MKHLIIILFFTLVALVYAEAAEPVKTEVYYFHKNRRCPTCMAIEKNTRQVLKEEPFATAKKNKDLEFRFLNADNSVNKKLVKEFGVSGSALVIVKGDEKTDLTNQAFLYARKQPEKFKQLLREALK